MGYNERRTMTVEPSCRVRMHGTRSGFVGAVLMIVFGTLIFFDNLGILPVSVFDAFWPLVFIGAGLYLFLRTASQVVRVWSAASIIAGVLLVLDDFQLIHVNMATLWPLALIATGVSMLVCRARISEFTNRYTIGSNTATRPISNNVVEVAIFSQVKRRIETQSFEGGDLSSVFGGIELDLRWAGISTPGRIAVLEANAAFGAIELRIPETWRISLQGNAVFGAYEDKTIPPRPDPGSETPTLVIKGGTAFGAVVVRN